MRADAPRLHMLGEVELDIFSGLPNPRWQLSSQEIDQLRRRVADLPHMRDVTPPPAGLGYRGVHVDLGSDGQLFIGGGLVQGADVTLHDRQRLIERWLLDTGKDSLDDDVWQAAARAFQ